VPAPLTQQNTDERLTPPFSLASYRIRYNDLGIGAVLGEGSFGTVYEATIDAENCNSDYISTVMRIASTRTESSGPTGLIEHFAHGKITTVKVAVKTVRSTKVTQATMRSFVSLPTR